MTEASSADGLVSEQVVRKIFEQERKRKIKIGSPEQRTADRTGVSIERVQEVISEHAIDRTVDSEGS